MARVTDHRRAKRVAQIVESIRLLELRSLERPAEAPQDRCLVERPGRVGIEEHESIATALPAARLSRSSSPATSSAIGTLRVERRDFGVPKHVVLPDPDPAGGPVHVAPPERYQLALPQGRSPPP